MTPDQRRNIRAARKLAQQRVFRILNGAPVKHEQNPTDTAPTGRKQKVEDSRLSQASAGAPPAAFGILYPGCQA